MIFEVGGGDDQKPENCIYVGEMGGGSSHPLST